MSQDDQRNHPDEEPARDVAAAAGSTEAARAAVPEEGAADTAAGSGATAATGATMATETTATSGATGTTAATAATGATGATTATETADHPRAASRREYQDQGEGAPRYAVVPEYIPRSGSEQSWSAAPNPGYQRDPDVYYPAKRVIAGTLIGALVMAGLVVYGARILTNRSGNGNGSAAWTAPVEKDGAVVNGINAPGNGSPPEVPEKVDLSSGNAGATSSGVFTAAIASCRTASAITLPVTAETGTPAAIRTWSAQAAAAAQKLRTDAATLQNVLNLGHADAVASAANTLCLSYPALAAVPPMPDAAGSQAWSSAASSFATAATQALQAVGGNPDAKGAALDALSRGGKQLAAMSARVDSVA